MIYTVFDGFTSSEVEDLSAIDKVLRSDPRTPFVRVQFTLPVTIEAMVRRNGNGEEVLMGTGERLRTFSRATILQNGDFEVSCSPDGAEVDVTSINLHFRSVEDSLTDRGLIWVIPGKPSIAMLQLRPSRFAESDESAATIIEAAKEAVRRKVLGHFLN